MKKTLFVLAICMTGIAAKAQDFKIGPRVGITSSTIKVDKESNSSNTTAQFKSGEAKIGYQLGGFVRLGVAGFYLQPELLFSSTGGEVTVQESNTALRTFKSSVKKLDVPVMFGKKFAKIARVNLGPTFSYIIKAEYTEAGLITQEIQNNYKRATVGYQAGVGVDLGPILLDLKYEGSLSKLGDSVGGYDTDQRQSIWTAAIGFSLL